jgi:uncharacterized protein
MTQYHEPPQELAPKDRDIVRALMVLKEEIEAVNWYHQRVATGADEELKNTIQHHLDEEIEHAVMILEWLRRNVSTWDEMLRTYLFTEAPLTAVEEAAVAGQAPDGKSDGASGSSQDLGLGSLK